MQFNTSKNKINKIENKQDKINNSLKNKSNKSTTLASTQIIIKTPTPLFDSGFQVFTSGRTFGGGNATNNSMTIASDITFTGSLNLTEEMIQNVKFSIIVKKPIDADIRGVFAFDISTVGLSSPDLQFGIFQENTSIVNINGDVIGNTGSGEGTSTEGDIFITIISFADVPIIPFQHNVELNNLAPQLVWSKKENNNWNFSIRQKVLLALETKIVDTFAELEGNRQYTATIVIIDEEPVITKYTEVDLRTEVIFPIYAPTEIDIEAKLILSFPYNDIWNNYLNYKS